MNIDKFQDLTGLTVSEADIPLVTAQIKRTQAALEGLLGYTLKKDKVNINYYEEKGKTQDECRSFRFHNVEGELDDPDDVIGSYRLFNYNKYDSYFHVDPFIKLNAVKLVHVKAGDEPNGVTVKTFNTEHIRVHLKNGFSKFIEKCDDCLCLCECGGCVQLAVDADWLYDACLPDELLYLWTDIVDYDPTGKKGLKSETLGPHSYTYFDMSSNTLEDQQALATIKKYAGPNGSIIKTVTL